MISTMNVDALIFISILKDWIGEPIGIGVGLTEAERADLSSRYQPVEEHGC